MVLKVFLKMPSFGAIFKILANTNLNLEIFKTHLKSVPDVYVTSVFTQLPNYFLALLFIENKFVEFFPNACSQ